MELADKIQNAAVASVMIQTEEGATKILSNMEVNLAEFVTSNFRKIISSWIEEHAVDQAFRTIYR